MATVSSEQEYPTWDKCSQLLVPVRWHCNRMVRLLPLWNYRCDSLSGAFFPKADYLAGLLLSFTANYFGFIARPIGGAFFDI